MLLARRERVVQEPYDRVVVPPWPAAAAVIAVFGFFTPLINAPVIGVLTVRTPPALRPKVMTAVMTVATVAGPLGFLAAGGGMMLGGLAFAAVLLRRSESGGAAADGVAVPDVAHG
jgi:hypothetical protein